MKDNRHKSYYLLLLCLFFFCFAQISFAQTTFMVKGKITDQQHEPLAGVTIKEKNTMNGTLSDQDGNYSIRVNSGAAFLTYSCTGFSTIEERVQGRKIINIVMENVDKDLDEIVVVGYGTVKRSDLTGSVSSIGKEAFSDRIITSIEDAMRGKAAGLQIIQNDGSPGSDFTMRIRGASSVNAGSAPIYVIDGVISTDATFLSPGDIEAIEILKDASATAIYGSRGANGVIIVTTKQGREGKAKVEFYTNIGWQSPSRTYDMMNSVEYARMRYQATGWKYYKYGTDPSTFADGTVYRDGTNADANYWVLANKNNSFIDWRSYQDSINTDWQDIMFQTAMIQEYRLNVSGGTTDTKYAISGGYLNQEGIVINSGYNRYSGRMNIEQKLSPKFKLIANLSSTRSKYTGLATGSMDGIISSLLRQRPTLAYAIEDLNEDLTGDGGALISNPYLQVKDISRDRYRDNFTARFVLDYNLNKRMLLRATGTYVDNNNKDKSFYPATTSQGFKSGGRAVVLNSDNTKLMGEAFIYYNNRFGKIHNLKLMGGTSVESGSTENLTTENQSFPSINLGADAIHLGTYPVIPITSIVEWNMASFFGRAEYSLKNKYLATITARYDGSSRFGSGNKWAFFPSAALAWRVSEEEIIKQLNIFDNFKLRLGAGRSGNTAIPSYRSLSTITTAFHPMDGESVNYGVVIDRPSSKTLKWETTDQYDAGLDLGFFENKLRIVIDAYSKTTKDLLLEKNTPLYSGYSKTWDNIGSIRNRGIEFSFGATVVKAKDWNWDVDFNIAFNKSKVLDIGPGGEMGFDPGIIPGSGNFVMIRKGQSLGQWYGYQVDGVYQSQYEIDDHGLTEVLGASGTSLTLRPGDHKFVDQNKDGKINSDDLTVLGRGEPLYTGGFTSTLSYKGFEFGFTLQYSYGAKVFNANLATLDSGREGYNQTTHIRDSWSPTLYTMSGELYEAGNPNGKYRLAGGAAENYCLSEFLEDGSFLRISDVTLGYMFSRKITKSLKIQGLKIFASAKNLHVFSNYSGYDPEVNTRQGQTGDLMPSLDFSSYPRSRTFSFGCNIAF